MNNTSILGEKEQLRAELTAKYGDQSVWDTTQLQETFEVISFMAPYCMVRHKKTKTIGTVEFYHSPRLYFDFKEC